MMEAYFLVAGLGLLWASEKRFPTSLKGLLKPLCLQALDLGVGALFLFAVIFLLSPWIGREYLIEVVLGTLFLGSFLYSSLRRRTHLFFLVLVGLVVYFVFLGSVYETVLKKGIPLVMFVVFTGFFRVLVVGLRQRLNLAALPKALEGASILFLLGAIISLFFSLF